LIQPSGENNDTHKDNKKCVIFWFLSQLIELILYDILFNRV
jgi:hypothetical protein